MALPAMRATGNRTTLVLAICVTRSSRQPCQLHTQGQNYIFKTSRKATSLEAQSSRASDEQTLYAKLGGAPAVETAVDIFYEKMMSDTRVNYFFEGIDMKKQRAHQTRFLSFALGAAMVYGGNANMTEAHQRLADQKGLRMQHFDIVQEHLKASLQDLHVPEAYIQEVMATVEHLRPDFQAAIDNAEPN